MKTLVLLLLLTVPALGSSEHMRLYHADQKTDEWIRSLERPDLNNGAGCCNLNDCERADAEWRGGEDGQWWVWSHVKGQGYVPVPPAKVVTKQKSIDGEAWLCQGRSQGTIYCFVPPDMGY